MSCATFFVALQCYECSTMQVKQRKNGSNINNKWTCVVCNQKQSVRKVFAQGPMAKDLRLFVQSFNMSRAQSQSQSQSQTFHLNHNEEPPFDLSSQIMTLKRPQTDWSQYLDNSEEDFQSKFDQQQQKSGDEFEPKIITELFKKPKLNKTCVSSDSEGGTGVKQLHKPVFLKRKLSVNATCPEQPRGFKSTTNSKKEQVETNECKMTLLKIKKTSKWDDCITGDDDVLAVRVFPDRVGDHGFDCRNDMLAELTDDEVVEDEIHSDFM